MFKSMNSNKFNMVTCSNKVTGNDQGAGDSWQVENRKWKRKPSNNSPKTDANR